MRQEEKERYCYPQVRVIPPGGPYFKWPWEKVHKVSVATQTINMACDPETPSANQSGTVLEAVTKDQLNTGLTGQIRYRVSEKNLYAYLFGVKHPIVHVMGYFTRCCANASPISKRRPLPRSRPPPAAFRRPRSPRRRWASRLTTCARICGTSTSTWTSECKSSEARYGIALEASLITGIDPPRDVESALAAINTAYNQVSSDISLAQAGADQKIVQSRTAVEIETLKAQAEVEPLMALAAQLRRLKESGPDALPRYSRNVRLKLFSQARRAILEVPP